MPEYSLQSHTIRIHPTLWKWAQEDAGPQGYGDGGASALIAGLLLYNHALRNRRHWLTADLVRDVDRLEKAMREVEQHNPLSDGPTWLEHRLQELIDSHQTNPEPTI